MRDVLSGVGSRMRCTVLLCCAAVSLGAVAQSPAAAETQDLDRQALAMCKAEKDPARKVTMLRQWVVDFGESSLLPSAHKVLFTTLVERFPAREKEIKAEGDWQIAQAKGADAKAGVENDLAYTLAEAKPRGAEHSGVALPVAEAWVKDALRIVPEAESNRTFEAMLAEVKKPVDPAEMHSFYARTRAARVQTLAEVYLRGGKLPEARQTVAEGLALNPTEGDLFDTRGMVEYAEHDRAKALEDLELASVYGGISSESSALMMRMYGEAHGGSDAGFAGEMDARYKQAFPPVALPKRAPIAGGHAVLVELFTGAGCEPCVAADLAVDDALRTYPAGEVVVLEWDQHIPMPDPLTNPGGVARASYYGVQYTPWLVVDGVSRELGGFGGRREQEGEMYGRLSKALDAEVAVDYGVGLRLTSSVGAGGVVTAHASVTVGTAEVLTKGLEAATRRNAADAEAVRKEAEEMRALKKSRGTAEAAAVATPAAAAAGQKLVVNFALAKDGVRYSRENGVRFHTMVARAGSAATPVELRGSAAASAMFDRKAITASLAEYLAAFAKHSERFGTIKFLSTELSLVPEHLYVVAWVSDAATRQVVQAAVVPVSAAMAAR